jgi:hypothetical protein
VSADIVILLDDDYRCPVLGGFNRRGKACGARPDDYDVGDFVPMPGSVCGINFACGRADERGDADSGDCFLDKSSARERLTGSPILSHGILSSAVSPLLPALT